MSYTHVYLVFYENEMIMNNTLNDLHGIQSLVGNLKLNFYNVKNITYTKHMPNKVVLPLIKTRPVHTVEKAAH